jgi:hypothetical protein
MAGSNNPPSHLCFSRYTTNPIRGHAIQADSPSGDWQVPKWTRKDRGCGSGSHLMRAFAGSKPLHGRSLLPLPTVQALILGDGRLTSVRMQPDSPSAPKPHTVSVQCQCYTAIAAAHGPPIDETACSDSDSA